MIFDQSLYKDPFIELINSEDTLFHFTSKHITIENILPNFQLKFGQFSKSNDPQEYRSNYINASGSDNEAENKKIEMAISYVDSTLSTKQYNDQKITCLLMYELLQSS